MGKVCLKLNILLEGTRIDVNYILKFGKMNDYAISDASYKNARVFMAYQDVIKRLSVG